MADPSGVKFRIVADSDIPTPASGKVHVYWISTGARYKDSAGASHDFPAVASFNGRIGAITPVQADYDAFFLTPAEGDVAYQPLDADLTSIAALTTTSFGRTFLDLADASAARTKLALGTAALNAFGDFQPVDSDLTAIAALTTTSYGRGLLTTADATALTAVVNDATGSLPGRLTSAQFAQLLVLAYVQAGIFNVRAAPYNATGDGSTDDASAINTAIAAANAYLAPTGSQRGAVVYFPPGVYKVGSALTTISGNGIKLIGAGRGATTIYVNHATADIVTFGSATEFCELREIQFFNATTRTAGAYINTNGANDLIIQDFGMSGYFTGISVSGGGASTGIKNYIDRGVIDSAAQTTSIGIDILNGAAGDTYISNVVMSNGGTVPTAGIRLRQTGHTSIHNCNVTKCDTGLMIDPQATDVTYVFVTDSLFDSCVTNAFKINPSNSASSRVRSLKFGNCWFAGTTGSNSPGINATTVGASAVVDDLTFIACRILNNGGNGVALAFGTNFRFSECTIAGNSQSSSNTLDGINVAANITDFSIQNCRIGAVGTASNTQRWAINIAAGTSTRFVISGNDLRLNATGALSQNGTGLISAVGNDNIGLPMDGPQATTATAAINTTETVLSQIPMGSNGINPGTAVEFLVSGVCTSTAANISTFTVRLGTAGTTGDTTVATFTVTSPTSGAGINFTARFRIRWPSGNGSVTPTGDWELLNVGVTGIVAAAVTIAPAATTATATTVTAEMICSLAYKSAATTTTSTFRAGRQGKVLKAA